MDTLLAEGLAGRLADLGLRFAEPVDLVGLAQGGAVEATVEHAQGRARYRVGFCDPLTGSAARRAAGGDAAAGRLLMLGPRVTERGAAALRSAGVDFADLAGNAHVSFEGVHIDVRGRRAPRSGARGPAAGGRARGGVNLFSVKRAQVVFAVLAWEDLLAGPVRGVARAAGVSVGQAQGTLALLAEYGFLDEGRRLVAARRSRLVDQWAAAYPTGLGSRARARGFSGDFGGLDPGDAVVYVSGQAAVPELLRPATAVLYSRQEPVEMIRAGRWRRDDQSPSILLRRQFWTPPAAEAPGARQAPWPLVYADLLASDDSRAREAAEQFRDGR
ncbi:MAG: hypothetical protein LBS56_02880 [Propionibacteriaceae bacterium]|nr:hypothetical protein [Propionibacteriaceae bacterium]